MSRWNPHGGTASASGEERSRASLGRQYQGQKSAELVPQYGGQEGFRRGLKETIDWFVQPKNLSAYKVGQYTL